MTSGFIAITSKNLMRGLPGDIKHYLNHIGVITGEQDYINKKFVLECMCSKSRGCGVVAVRALDYIQKRGK